MWDLVSAVAFVRQVRPLVEAVGFSVGLTGGTMFNGHSSKDVDLVFYKYNSPDADYNRVLQALKAGLGVASLVAVKHANDAKLVFAMGLADGRRVDLFFPGFCQGDRRDSIAFAGYKSSY